MVRRASRKGSEMEANRIHLSVLGGTWHATYSGHHSEMVRELFGTVTLPTPFTSAMETFEVMRKIAATNLDVEVTADPHGACRRNPRNYGDRFQCNSRSRKAVNTMKNTMRKLRKPGDPHETWVSRDGSWRWEVLKKYQADDTKPFARWLCAVYTPHTFPTYDIGDVYAADVMREAHKVEVGRLSWEMWLDHLEATLQGTVHNV